jgi:prevent-host-death family protein
MDWKLADAKNKFSEVVKRALREGPQRVLRRDDAVIVLSEEDYERLAGSRLSFKEFLLSVPDIEGIDLERDKSPMRDVDL